ncbi:MAG: hypothetical protein K0S11_1564 [Gammaproteobacteria bacterium]|jgi:hypothetical protein|nr:hypothetical protein [Gammaproteobacteria bacterium]
MNKIKPFLAIFALSGFCTMASAYCSYANNELQNTCVKIEQGQQEARQTLQGLYDNAAPKSMDPLRSALPASGNTLPNSQQVATTNANTTTSNKANQLDIFSSNNNPKSIFK